MWNEDLELNLDGNKNMEFVLKKLIFQNQLNEIIFSVLK